MCGIALLIDPSLAREVVARLASAAASTLIHRGPDGNGIEAGEGWGMAHTRLAIIDLVGGAQPMGSPDGRYWLTFNGEIYNYRELRSSLQSRWTFRSQGDTEVLLAGLVLEGPGFLARANGMWAFALWDSIARRLLLARDRIGKKPLYFRCGDTAFACASELPVLRRLMPDFAWEEDQDSTGDYLRYGFALPGFTAYRDTFEVLPGHSLEWAPGTTAHQQRYWSVANQPFAGSQADAARTVRELLTASVRLRLVADVDVGSFLSGGVDSSLVSTLAARQIGHRLRTFTMGFADRSYDESESARRMAETLGSLHETEIIDALDAKGLGQLLTHQVGAPFADPSLLPTAALSRMAARHVKVALSGDGGDELFAGYQRYLGRVLLRWYTRLPSAIRSSGEKLLHAFPEPLHHHSRSLLKKAHLFVATATQSEGDPIAYVAPRLFSDAQMRALAPALCARGHAPPGLPERCHIDDVQYMMTADVLTYLPQDILVKTDRASMAHSLEVRCPFLDHRLVEVALTAGTQRHLRGLRGKRLLREACGDVIPAWVWRRRKQGFAVPVGSWFRGALGNSLQEAAEREDHTVRAAAVVALLDEHRAGAHDHGLRLWALWSYLQWRERGLAATINREFSS